MISRLHDVAAVIIANAEGIYVKCIDYWHPTKSFGGKVEDLEQAYRLAADVLKDRLRANIESQVDQRNADYRRQRERAVGS